jgi:uncharacterized membrane protein YuzA (DUF378 family)
MSSPFVQSIKATPITIITQILIIVGALNWLLVGSLKTNYISKFLPSYAHYVFILVGIAGIYQLYVMLNSFTETQLPASVTNLLKVIDERKRA